MSWAEQVQRSRKSTSAETSLEDSLSLLARIKLKRGKGGWVEEMKPRNTKWRRQKHRKKVKDKSTGRGSREETREMVSKKKNWLTQLFKHGCPWEQLTLSFLEPSP